MTTETTPTAPADEVSVIYQLLGATIVGFGGNAEGEIFLVTQKGDERKEFIIGKEPDGEITLYEVEHREVPA